MFLFSRNYKKEMFSFKGKFFKNDQKDVHKSKNSTKLSFLFSKTNWSIDPTPFSWWKRNQSNTNTKIYMGSDVDPRKTRRKTIEQFVGAIFFSTLELASNGSNDSSISNAPNVKQEREISSPTQVADEFLPSLKVTEKNLELVDKLYVGISSISSLYCLFLFATSYSKRFSEKIKLPLNYEPNQISSYYKLRPEKVIIRFSQIFFQIFKFILVLTIDIIFNPEKNSSFEKIKEKKEYNNQFLFILTYPYIFKKKSNKKGIPGSRLTNAMQIFSLKKKKTEQKNLKAIWDNKAKNFRKTIANLSPAFVKIAQAFASRPDIVTERVANELQRLQDDMPFFSNEKAFEFIRKELGVHHSRIFSEISESPVAAASLGQVYKALLDNVPVAIKVQRPGLVELIALDMLIIRFLGYMFQQLLQSKTDLVASVDEYAERLFEELDYRKEASNMIKFRSLYGYMDMIYIPRVFVDYSSQRVLVMDWVQGDRLVKDSVKVSQEDISLIETGVKCSLVQLLEIGFLHCDPHAGNLIKTKNGKLAYLDFGLVSEVPESVRFSFITAILHLINKEYESLAKDFSGLALIRSDDLDKELNLFSEALSVIFDESLSNFENITFQDIAEKFFLLSFKFPFILPPYFLNNLRAIATLEGLGKIADPSFKIADIIYPYIINRLLTNSGPQFQNALEKFLLDNRNSKPNWEKLEALLQDPEWTETFSEQSENLSDTILNFFISPTGKFVNRIVLKELTDLFLKHLTIENVKNTVIKTIDVFKKKKNFSKKKKKNYVYKKTTFDMSSLLFLEAKLYYSSTFFSLAVSCIQGSLIVFSEILLRFLKVLTLKISKILKIW